MLGAAPVKLLGLKNVSPPPPKGVVTGAVVSAPKLSVAALASSIGASIGVEAGATGGREPATE